MAPPSCIFLFSVLKDRCIKLYDSFICIFSLQVNGMNQLWGIALRAQNTDVSLTAIQYLNNYYINCKLTHYLIQFKKHEIICNSFKYSLFINNLIIFDNQSMFLIISTLCSV